MKINLTPEQTKAYNRFILARDKIAKSKTWIRPSTVSHCIDVAGTNHPVFVVNDPWVEYQEAFDAWLAVEPTFRHEERMRSSRGDYEGAADNWEDKPTRMKEL